VSSPADAATVSPDLVCFVSGDGVRIHTQPSSSSTVLGLAYRNDNWIEVNLTAPSGWDYGTDATTNVTGYISTAYLADCYE
jgi:hypothetical protein